MIPLSVEDTLRLREGFCPNCGCARFVMGPSGGAARNILCSACHFEFCRTIVGRGLQLPSPCPPNRLREVYGIESAEKSAA